ncbi:MAG: thiamine phosphate synthase [Phycisphaerales bacterium]|nr:thiamine phosphate synthase [Phycisphaerales bacterium]
MSSTDPAILRILDANANRAREALRVLEDIARFAFDDAQLAERTKSMRHALGGALAPIANTLLAAARDVEGDVGTSIKGALESSRDGLRGVALAAGKRLTESVRSLEESMKALGESASASMFERLRYDAYILDAAFALRFGGGVKRQWSVCLLLTEALCRTSWSEVLDGALAAGVDCIQVREKTMHASALLARVCAVRERALAVGASTIVNDDLGVALASGADGVHLGCDDLPVRSARKCVPASFIIGASTHSLEEARRAIESGADYCGVGAMFATAQKPELAPTGEAYLQAYLAHFTSVPHLAIGGIDAPRAAQLSALGCRGVAVSSALCRAEDPLHAARELLSAMRSRTRESVSQ